MPYPKKATDEQLILAYSEHHSVHKVGALFGMRGYSVHERLVKLGIDTAANVFTEAERHRLLSDYENYADSDDLQTLADQMGRTRYFLCKQAKALGLTDRRRRPSKSRADGLRDAAIRHRLEKGHPKGMLGKNHSAATCERLSEVNLKRFASMDRAERQLYTHKRLEGRLRKRGALGVKAVRGTWKAGWRTIAGRRIFFRSRWEANYARFLEAQRISGRLLSWEHETKTFRFTEILGRGSVYLPDFQVQLAPGAVEYHEVKGWFDQRSKDCLNSMAELYPHVRVVVIAKAEYMRIERAHGRSIEGWEWPQKYKTRQPSNQLPGSMLSP